MKKCMNMFVAGVLLSGLGMFFPVKAKDTPLIQAVNKGNIERVGQLIAAGADVNEPGGMGMTPLMNVIYMNQQAINRAQQENRDLVAEMVSMLLAHKADVNAVAVRGNTALLLALQGGKFRIAALLIKAGAQVNAVNKAGETPLLLAVQRNNLAMVLMLTKRGALVGTQDRERKTALDYAREFDNPLMIKVLENASAKGQVKKESVQEPWWKRWFGN